MVLKEAYDLFIEYSRKSTIHGVSYFGERQRHWIERVWWMTAIIFSVSFCSFLIHKVYQKWDENPIIISFATKPSSVWEVPFPAITICPENKVQRKLLNFTDVFTKMALDDKVDNETLGRLETLYHVCNRDYSLDFPIDDTIAPNRIADAIKSLAISTKEIFIDWGRFTNEFYYVQEILTEEGVCVTFNSFQFGDMYKDVISTDFSKNLTSFAKDQNFTLQWTLEHGFDKSVPTDNFTYPYRTFLAGYGVKAHLLAIRTEDVDSLCRYPYQGYKLLLHLPNEVPNFARHFQNIRVPTEKDVTVAVTPNLVTTSDGLRNYHPHRRQCYYNSERFLRFFKHYTQSNCEVECLTNFTLNYCQCVKFSMPHDANTLICGAKKISCYEEAAVELKKPNDLEGSDRTLTPCNCLPACTAISYSASVFHVDYDYEKHRDIRIGNSSSVILPSRASVFYQKDYFTASLRSELYGRTDFIANCGGLIGLCIGASILSIIEVLYFCTIRIFLGLKYKKPDNNVPCTSTVVN